MDTSTFLAWAGSIATIIFGVLSVYFYLRTRTVKKLACVVGYATLQRRLHPDVRISFRGIEVESLSRVLAFVWNGGTSEIRKADVPNERWPTIIVPAGSTILSLAVLKTSSDHISLSAHLTGDSSLSISFSYLNPGDGAVLELLVAGLLGSGDVEFVAPLIGGSEPAVDELKSSAWTEIWLPVIIEATTGVTMGAAGAFWYQRQEPGGLQTFLVVLSLAILSFAAGTYLQFKPLRRRLPAFARDHLKTVAAAYGLK